MSENSTKPIAIATTEAQRGLLALAAAHPGTCALNLGLLLPLPRARWRDTQECRSEVLKVVRSDPRLSGSFSPDGKWWTPRPAPEDIVHSETVADPEELARLAARFVAIPVHPMKDPLLAILVVEAGKGGLHLVVRAHHALMDGWGLSRFVRRILEGDLPPPVPEAPRDPVRLRRDLDWWMERLPLDPVPGTVRDLPPRARRSRFPLDPGSSGVEDVPALLALVLGRHSRKDGICLGVLSHGRRGGRRGDLAPHVDLLPIHVAPKEGATLATYLDSFRERTRACLRHAVCRNEERMRELRRRGVEGRVWSAIYSFHPSSFSPASGLDAAECWVFPGEALEPLSFHLVQHAGGGCSLLVDWSTDRFQEREIEGMVSVLRHLLESKPRQAAIPLRDLRYLPEGEEARILAAGRRPAPEGRTGPTLWHSLRGWAGRDPESPSIRWTGGLWTRGQLLDRVESRASWLSELGVGPGDVVAVLGDPGPGRVADVLAVNRAGAAFAPLDETAPASWNRQVARVVGATHVWAPDGSGGLEEIGDAVAIPPPPPQLDPGRCRRPEEPAGSALAYVVATSGSSGRPKGVQVEHASWVALADAWLEEYGLGPRDAILQLAPFCFDVFLGDLAKAIACGGVLLLPAPRERSTPALLLEFAREHRATFVDSLPDIVLPLARAAIRDGDFGTLRWLVSGARAPHAGDFAEIGRNLPDSVRLCNSYGVTEATVDSTLHRWSPTDPPCGPIPIGRAFPGTGCHVVSSTGHPLPDGWVGEILLEGAGVARGYAGESDDPRFGISAEGVRTYRTGDLGVRNGEGEVVWVGREDGEVKLGGARTHTSVLEAHLAGLDCVSDVVVVADVAGGSSGSPRVVAWCVGSPDRPCDETIVREGLRKHLPERMQPEIRILDALPRTASGKPDLEALRNRSTSRGGQPLAMLSPEGGRSVRDRIVDCLRPWIPPEEFADPQARRRPLWALGLDSLASFQFLDRLAEEGWMATPSDLLAHPSLEDLAQFLMGGDPRPRARAVPPPRPRGARNTRPPGGAVLVTGATGFLGRELVKILLAQDRELVCLGRGGLDRLGEGVSRSVEWWEGDLEDPRWNLEEESRLDRLGAVVHLAAKVGYLEDPSTVRRVNVEATSRFAAFCAERGIPFLHASSQSVSSPLPEGSNPYVDSKRLAEKVVVESRACGAILRIGGLLPEPGVDVQDALRARLATLARVGGVPGGNVGRGWGDVARVSEVAKHIAGILSVALHGQRPTHLEWIHLRGRRLNRELLEDGFARAGHPLARMDTAIWESRLGQQPMGALLLRELRSSSSPSGGGFLRRKGKVVDVSEGAETALVGRIRQILGEPGDGSRNLS